MPKAKLIRVGLKQRETLYITESPDLVGLIVSARSVDEVLAETTAAIKEMLDFAGRSSWVVNEVENPEAIGAEYAFAALPALSPPCVPDRRD